MEGTVITLRCERGYDNYKEKLGDPMAEDTLIMGDEDNNVVLLFRHSTEADTCNGLGDGIDISSNYRYDTGCIIHNRKRPSDLPQHIKNAITERHFAKLNPTFFENNFKKGGMVSLKSVKRHPDWREEYRHEVNIKRINMCKSCKSRAYKGCCSEYSPTNRVMVKMILGWSMDVKSIQKYSCV